MTLYLIDDDRITSVPSTTFAQQGIEERRNLQTLLKAKPEVISPDTLIVAEEFSNWEDSLRRIDLLGIDKNANLVVIELKRTEDGGHMDLQSIRYAAMISAMTFDMLVELYQKFLNDDDVKIDAKESLVEFLEWDDTDEHSLGEAIRIVLASAEFSKELTTSVLWLNDQGLDIRCVRMRPYDNDGQVLLDVQTIIPIPEAEEYQIRIREKRQRERVARESKRDTSKYDVTVNGKLHANLNKRNLIFLIVSEVVNGGGNLLKIVDMLPSSKFRVFDSILNAEEIREKFTKEDPGGQLPRYKRFFCDDGQPFHVDGKTYVLSNQWSTNTADVAMELANEFLTPIIEIRQAGT